MPEERNNQTKNYLLVYATIGSTKRWKNAVMPFLHASVMIFPIVDDDASSPNMRIEFKVSNNQTKDVEAELYKKLDGNPSLPLFVHGTYKGTSLHCVYPWMHKISRGKSWVITAEERERLLQAIRPSTEEMKNPSDDYLTRQKSGLIVPCKSTAMALMRTAGIQRSPNAYGLPCLPGWEMGLGKFISRAGGEYRAPAIRARKKLPKDYINNMKYAKDVLLCNIAATHLLLNAVQKIPKKKLSAELGDQVQQVERSSKALRDQLSVMTKKLRTLETESKDLDQTKQYWNVIGEVDRELYTSVQLFKTSINQVEPVNQQTNNPFWWFIIRMVNSFCVRPVIFDVQHDVQKYAKSITTLFQQSVTRSSDKAEKGRKKHGARSDPP